ncbi:MAG: 30S ribosomal protein S9 [Candidatus Pacebacteria bacterium]|nr:30S ribosomal protein S9 [Candidatus Paceibacterota bacterium]
MEREYIESKGGRKTARSRVRIWPKIHTNEIIINDKKLEEYFTSFENQLKVKKPLDLTGQLGKFKITVNVHGGGKKSQAEAVSLGISRCLLEINQDFRVLLASHKLLTRDPRQKERKKFGLKKARKAPQWQKR